MTLFQGLETNILTENSCPPLIMCQASPPLCIENLEVEPPATKASNQIHSFFFFFPGV